MLNGEKRGTQTRNPVDPHLCTEFIDPPYEHEARLPTSIVTRPSRGDTESSYIYALCSRNPQSPPPSVLTFDDNREN